MPTREIKIPTGERGSPVDGRGFGVEPHALMKRCERQRLDIDRLTAAVTMFRQRIAALEAVNAQLRADNAKLLRAVANGDGEPGDRLRQEGLAVA